MGCCYSCMDDFKNEIIDACVCCRCPDCIEPGNYDGDECYCPNSWACLSHYNCNVDNVYFTKVSKGNLCEEMFWFLPRNLSCLACCSLIITFSCLFECCDGCCSSDNRSIIIDSYKCGYNNNNYNNNNNNGIASDSASANQRLSSLVSHQPQSVFATNNRLTLV